MQRPISNVLLTLHSPVVLTMALMLGCGVESPDDTTTESSTNADSESMSTLSSATESSATAPSSTESSSTSAGDIELGDSSLIGDAICAHLMTPEDCAATEVSPGIFCDWRRSAFIVDASGSCEPLQLGEGCFAFDTTSFDPGCATPEVCDKPIGYFQPFTKEIDSGWLVVDSCGVTPINGFEHCPIDDTAPLTCQCVCALAPSE